VTKTACKVNQTLGNSAANPLGLLQKSPIVEQTVRGDDRMFRRSTPGSRRPVAHPMSGSATDHAAGNSKNRIVAAGKLASTLVGL
jgi:hypothetical protein